MNQETKDSLKKYGTQAAIDVTVFILLVVVGAVVWHFVGEDKADIDAKTAVTEPATPSVTTEDIKQMVREAVATEIKTAVTTAVDDVRQDATEEAQERQEMQALVASEIAKQFADVRRDVQAATFREIREDAALRGALLTGQTVLVSSPPAPAPSEPIEPSAEPSASAPDPASADEPSE